MKQAPVAYYAQPQRRIRSGGNRRSSSGGCGSILSSLVVVGLLAGAGVYLFAFGGLEQLQDLLGFGSAPATRSPTASPVPTVPTLKPTPLPTTARTTDYVQVIFTNAPATTPTVTTAFMNAATRWSNVLAGTNMASVSYSSNTFNDFSCSLTNDGAIPDGSTDRLIIAADIAPIDGVGSVLGRAGPCNRFSATTGPSSVLVPVLGAMTFDSADLASLDAAGTLEDVILHEMGHVLGIGTLWDTTDPPVVPAPLIVDPIFFDVGDIRPANDPAYQGHAAKAEYFTISASTGNIPVEDGSFAGLTPAQLLAGQGQGSVDGHWRESVFDTELMTPAIDSGVANPLSIMSLRSLEDLGYAVDPSHADAYTLPGPSSGVSKAKSSGTQRFYMSDDIFVPEGFKEAYQEAKRDMDRRLSRLGGSL